MESGISTLSVNKAPVPSPCGKGLLNVAHHCAMAFSPIFDSNAEVIHQPIFCCSASSIHSCPPLIPPCKDGFSMIYCGRITDKSSFFLSIVLMPISSSSKAIGKGVSEVSRAISSHCPARIGCSMECRSSSASRCNLFRASSGEKAPFASTRNSISLAEKCARICFNKASSSSKLIAPIFNLIQRKPDCILTSICSSIFL